LVLVLPAGNDAHTETGYALGQRKRVFILLSEAPLAAPELMYLLPGIVTVASIRELIAHLRQSPTIHKLYIASSWTRSANHPAVVAATRAARFQVFDYRAVAVGNSEERS
jgi:hypothetical protein